MLPLFATAAFAGLLVSSVGAVELPALGNILGSDGLPVVSELLRGSASSGSGTAGSSILGGDIDLKPLQPDLGDSPIDLSSLIGNLDIAPLRKEKREEASSSNSSSSARPSASARANSSSSSSSLGSGSLPRLGSAEGLTGLLSGLKDKRQEVPTSTGGDSALADVQAWLDANTKAPSNSSVTSARMRKRNPLGIELKPLIPSIPGVTEPLASNAPPLPVLQLPTPALPSPDFPVNNKLKPKKVGYIWTGAGDNIHSDFLATVSLDDVSSPLSC